jgi:hypothetical protein
MLQSEHSTAVVLVRLASFKQNLVEREALLALSFLPQIHLNYLLLKHHQYFDL